MTRARVRLPLVVLALAAAAAAVSGCTQVEDALGISTGTKTNILTLQSIELRSDHSTSPTDPTAAAVATNGAVVRFVAIGTYQINGGATTATNDATSAVVFASTNPAALLPGADGRAVVSLATAGSVTITATSPALGSIPAQTSNPITVTVP